MDNITYNVRIWKTEVYKGAKVTTYKVWWKTGDAPPWKEPFRNSAQAESFRSALVTPARNGEAFRIDTGRPVSWGRQDNSMNWYDFCVLYVDMKWKHSAAKRRATIAWTLVTVMPPMIATTKAAPEPKAMRRALRQWHLTPTGAPNARKTPPQFSNGCPATRNPSPALSDPNPTPT